MKRRLSDKDMADLPSSGWQNMLVDARKYYPSILAIWEVDHDRYETARAEGILCREYGGKYYIAQEGSALDYLTGGV